MKVREFTNNLFNYIIRKKPIISLMFITYIPTIIHILLLIIVFSFPSIKMLYYVASYETGFLKRALLGELLRIINFQITFFNMLILFFLIAIISIYIFLKFVKKEIKKQDMKKTGIYLFFIFLLTHIATINQMIYEFGRLDQINLIITILCIYLIKKYKDLNFIFLYPLILVGLLIHEAFLIINFPLIFFYWLYKIKYNNYKNILRYTIFILVIISSLLIINLGEIKHTTPEEYTKYIETNYGSKFIHEDTINVFFRSTKDNIIMTVSHLFSFSSFIDHIMFIFILFPTLYIFYKIFRNPFIKYNKDFKLLLIAAVSPLGLYFLGVDFPRWWALTITNIFIVTILLLEKKEFKESLNKIFIKNKKIIFVLVFIHIILGPLGVNESFPRIRSIVNKIKLFFLS